MLSVQNINVYYGKIHAVKDVSFEVNDGENVKLGAFDITFFSMTHSIPAAFGVFFKTPAGTVLHTGDFKLDQTPIDGVTPNYNAINSFGESTKGREDRIKALRNAEESFQEYLDDEINDI